MIKKHFQLIIVIAFMGLFISNQMIAQDKKNETADKKAACKKTECTSEKLSCKDKSEVKKDCCKNKSEGKETTCCKDKSDSKCKNNKACQDKTSCKKDKSCKKDSDMKEACKEKCDAKGTATSKISNKVCPVMGENVDATVETVDYKGNTIGFCCKKCVEKFKKDPGKYMNKLKVQDSKADKS
jgi:YHS domain-containing protein